ncbi:CHAT domain-containing protein [Sphingobacterium olei]|uniref:CHAT domain-containing protein n=1 Tax=Sphingobacterium olei TaxID=2571155 RepID=A0A4U0P2F3_9SPHI|nr:CHAT domain-containing tetratricopeptide repeat protein [Sphingobacterium olei]TJZ60722.1 CHAT domain-containing protein [Sphingobacterium olei]
MKWTKVGICFLLSVGACTPKQNPDDSAKAEPLDLVISSKIGSDTGEVIHTDEVFEQIADIAEGQPEKFIHHPDSFYNTIPNSPRTPYQRELYVYTLSNMGYQLRDHADILHSIKYYEKALQATKTYALTDVDIDNDIIMPLANLYIRIDDNKKAISLLEQAISTVKTAQNLSSFTNNLANAYIYDNNPSKAKSVILNGLQSGTSLKPLLYNTLTSIYWSEDKIDSCKMYNQKALAEFEKMALTGDSILWYTNALSMTGRLSSLEQPIKTSLKLLEKTFPTHKLREKAKLQLELATIYYTRSESNKALSEYKNVLSYFSTTDKYQLDYTYTQALGKIGDCYANLNELDSAIDYYQWAIENDYRTQQLIVSKENQLKNNIWHKNLIESAIAICERKLEIQPNDSAIQARMLWCIELGKARMLITEINRSEKWDSQDLQLQQAIQIIRTSYQDLAQLEDNSQRERLEKRIKNLLFEFQLSENYFEKISPPSLRHEFMEKLRNQDADYYSYFIHQDSSITILGLLNKKTIYKKLNDKNLITTIEEFKKSYFGNTPNVYNLSPANYKTAAHNIAQYLLPDIAHAKPNIFLSLDGVFHGLPFDALWDSDFLIKSHNFSYLNSFLLFDILPNNRVLSTPISILHQSEYQDPLPSLHFVKEEVKNIADKFQSQIIDPQRQHDSVLSEEFSSLNVIHIAAHAILEADKDPYIYLKNQVSTNQLSYYEMNTPLVFLSACNTGTGKPLPSEGTESIHRVFLSRGVPSVISTYWFANDEMMLFLTASFYEQLYNTRFPMEALGEAKRNFLITASDKQANPWYWANINYAGVNNEIGLKKSSNLFFYSSIIAISLIMLLFLGCIRSKS